MTLSEDMDVKTLPLVTGTQELQFTHLLHNWSIIERIITDDPNVHVHVNICVEHTRAVLDDLDDDRFACLTRLSHVAASAKHLTVLAPMSSTGEIVNNRPRDTAWLDSMGIQENMVRLFPKGYYPLKEQQARPFEWNVFINLSYPNVTHLVMGMNYARKTQFIEVDEMALFVYEYLTREADWCTIETIPTNL